LRCFCLLVGSGGQCTKIVIATALQRMIERAALTFEGGVFGAGDSLW
jgi:hypothetical protein